MQLQTQKLMNWLKIYSESYSSNATKYITWISHTRKCSINMHKYKVAPNKNAAAPV